MTEVIKTVGLCKENILFDVNFSMNKGEMAAVMGPSGSGKSTLLYQLSGMDRPDEGEVLFDGDNICTYSEDMRADMRLNKMGFVFQQMNMLKNLNLLDGCIKGEFSPAGIVSGKEREAAVSRWLAGMGW